MAAIGNITFACEDPQSLARFWARVLDYDREELPAEFENGLREAGHDPDDACAISDPEGAGPRLFFKRMERSAVVAMPIHLDLHVKDRRTAVDAFVEMGATERETKELEAGEHREIWTVMSDPEDNGFCVYARD